MRSAIEADYERLETLRDAFFAKYEGRVQVRPFTGGAFVWMVATANDRVVAALSFADLELRQRWVWDLYRERGRWGTAGVYALVNWLEATTDAEDRELLFLTDPRNARHRRAVEHSQRGYALVAHVYHRPRWGKR